LIRQYGFTTKELTKDGRVLVLRSDYVRSSYPSLYQINARVWLTELSRSLSRPVTLDDIPDATGVELLAVVIIVAVILVATVSYIAAISARQAG
jgi:uncharacterized YccA/Bax inhibitor family protein